MAVSSEHLHNVNTHVQGLKSLEGNCVTVALLLQELYGWKIIDGFFRLDSPAILAGHTWNMTEKGDIIDGGTLFQFNEFLYPQNRIPPQSMIIAPNDPLFKRFIQKDMCR